MCAVPQHSPCKGCFVSQKGFEGWLQWGMADLVMCHPNHNCPGLLMQGKGFVISLHLHVLLYPSTSPNLFKFILKKTQENPAVPFPFFLSGSLRDVHTFGHSSKPNHARLVTKTCKKSYTRWAKSPCIWYLLETAHTPKAEGQRFPSWSKLKLPHEFSHHTAVHRHAWEISQNKAWASFIQLEGKTGVECWRFGLWRQLHYRDPFHGVL